MKDEDKINLKYLPKYGITDEILKDMITYDIMFPIDKRTRNGKTDYFVKKSDVFLFLNAMLKNQMSVYKMVDEADTKTKDIVASIGEI